MNQMNPQGLTAGIPRPPMSQAPQDQKEWLRALLMGATLFSGMAGQKKGDKAPPGGFKAPEKPLLAQSFHALAQGIEQKAKGEQLMQEAQKEQRAKKEKEEFEQKFKMYGEQMKSIRQSRDIASREKIAEIRETVPGPTEFELEKQRLTLKQTEANIKKINAGTAKIYADMKRANDPKAEMFNIPKQYQKYFTPVATEVYADLDDAYKRAVGGDRSAFDVVRNEIESKAGEMQRTTTNVYGQTQTDVQDQSNLISLWSWMDTQLTGAGVESTQEGDIAKMIELYNAGDYGASENIGIKYGLTTDQYKDYVQPVLGGAGEGKHLGAGR